MSVKRPRRGEVLRLRTGYVAGPVHLQLLGRMACGWDAIAVVVPDGEGWRPISTLGESVFPTMCRGLEKFEPSEWESLGCFEPVAPLPMRGRTPGGHILQPKPSWIGFGEGHHLPEGLEGYEDYSPDSLDGLPEGGLCNIAFILLSLMSSGLVYTGELEFDNERSRAIQRRAGTPPPSE